jgi:hypothetical protein
MLCLGDEAHRAVDALEQHRAGSAPPEIGDQQSFEV